MLNHGLYTDALWSVPIVFKDAAGSPVDLSGFQYLAEVWLNGTKVFTFKSTGGGATDGVINLANAASGQLVLTATVSQHAGVQAGLYRIHIKRDLTDDVWVAEGDILVGEPGDRETYIKMDQNRSSTVNAAVYLPIVIGDGGSGIDLGNPGGPSGEIFDMGSPS